MKIDPQRSVQGDALLHQYRLHLNYSRRQPTTVRQRMVYTRQLFARFPRVLRVTHRDLVDWIYGRDDWSAETTNAAVSSCRIFYRWAVAEGKMKASPAEALWTVPVPTRVKEIADDRRVESALAGATPEQAAIILLGNENGLRRSEIVACSTHDRTGEWLTTTGKHGRTRITHISAELAAALDALTPAGGGYYFPGRFGGHRSGSWLYDQVRALLATHPHAMRRRAITKVYRGDPDNGYPRDIVKAQRFAGHSSADTTGGYIDVGLDQLRDAGTHTRVSRAA